METELKGEVPKSIRKLKCTKRDFSPEDLKT